MQGLHYIHDSKGVVHRDLTPSNLVLGRSPHGLPVVKLADFGLAKQQTDNNVMQSMVRCRSCSYDDQYRCLQMSSIAPVSCSCHCQCFRCPSLTYLPTGPCQYLLACRWAR